MIVTPGVILPIHQDLQLFTLDRDLTQIFIANIEQ